MIRRRELFLLRGLPGSGKSTLANRLLEDVSWYAVVSHCENDQELLRLCNGEYNWTPERAYRAALLCQDSCEKAMIAGTDKIVVSNTFTTERQLKPYIDLAELYDYTVYSLVVENRHEGVSVHDVPEETLQNMKDRFNIKL